MPKGNFYARNFRKVYNYSKKNPIRRLRMRRNKVLKSIISNRKIYSFTRSHNSFSNINTAVAFGNSAFQFKLSDVPNSSEFTTLFDSYRIMAVKFTMIPTFTYVEANTAAPVGAGSLNESCPQIYTVIDRDDVTALSTVTDYMQYDTYKMHRGNKVITRYIKWPRIQLAGNVNGASALGFQGRPKQWLDCNSNNIPHFGIKVGIDSSSTAGYYVYRVYCKYYLQFKDTR